MSYAPLTQSMDNVDAWKLGECARDSVMTAHGDLIDVGLVLRRKLEESGYALTRRGPNTRDVQT